MADLPRLWVTHNTTTRIQSPPPPTQPHQCVLTSVYSLTRHSHALARPHADTKKSNTPHNISVQTTTFHCWQPSATIIIHADSHKQTISHPPYHTHLFNKMTITKEMEATEPLLKENPDRFCMFPIHYNSVWEMYKKAEASFWTGADGRASWPPQRCLQ